MVHKPQKNLEEIAKEADALGKSRVIRTEEARAIVNLVTRLAETLAHGEPTTEKIVKHHG